MKGVSDCLNQGNLEVNYMKQQIHVDWWEVAKFAALPPSIQTALALTDVAVVMQQVANHSYCMADDLRRMSDLGKHYGVTLSAVNEHYAFALLEPRAKYWIVRVDDEAEDDDVPEAFWDPAVLAELTDLNIHLVHLLSGDLRVKEQSSSRTVRVGLGDSN
jgi:hypothetical protein